MHETPVAASPAREMRVIEVEPVFTSVDEAARFLNLNPREVYRLLDQGQIQSVHHGRRRLIIVATLRAYAERLVAGTAA